MRFDLSINISESFLLSTNFYVTNVELICLEKYKSLVIFICLNITLLKKIIYISLAV